MKKYNFTADPFSRAFLENRDKSMEERIALGMLAVGMGSVTTLMPIVTRDLFGSREYAAIWGILSAVSNLGALIATPLFGTAFDLSGSYDAAMIAAGIAVAAGLITLKIALDRGVSM